MAQQTEYCRGIPEADRKRPGGETSPPSIRFYCPGCGQKLRAGSDGEKGRCPKCRLRVMAPDWPDRGNVYTADPVTGKLSPTPWWELPPEPEGPVGLDGFRLDGKVARFSKNSWRLLVCLHKNHRGITWEKAMKHVYGDDDLREDGIKSTLKRLNKRLRDLGWPFRVREVQGKGIVLERLSDDARH